MRNKLSIATCLLLLLISSYGYTQINSEVVVNNGDLYILPNTLISSHFDFQNTNDGVVFNDGEFQFYKNYINDGMFTHTTNLTTGYTVFQGTNPQVISGSMPSIHFDVLFNNASNNNNAFQLNNDFIIDGKANFFNGIVKINKENNGALLFTNNANHINTSNKSFAEGVVEKIGNKSFTFPVGKNSYYRHASISAPKNMLDSFKTEHFFDNITSSHPHLVKDSEIVEINNAEYWEITTENSTSSLILTLSWHEDTTPDSILNDSENLVIVRWDVNTKQWVNEGGIVDYANKTVTTPVEVSKYGIFTIARELVIIPSNEIIVYNYLSTNGNSKNDYLIIENIEKYPNNTLQIFNRYGVKVYETNSYGSNNNFFAGYSETNSSANDKKLPSGTYYYILTYLNELDPSAIKSVKKVGYIHLENR